MRTFFDGLLILVLVATGFALLAATFSGLGQEWPAAKRSFRRWRTMRREKARAERAIDQLIRETRKRERV